MGLAVAPDAQAQVSVEGAWTATEWTVNGETQAAQRGIFIFTATHYSFFFVGQPDDRAAPAAAGPGEMTDAEKVTAYDEFTANAGRYTIEGNTLTTQAYMAKNPNYMAAFSAQERTNAQTRTFSIEDGTLTLRPTSGNGVGGSVTLRRPGQ
jgi:hypothetical protein